MDSIRHLIGLALVRRAVDDLKFRRAAALLLHGMRQFMRQQAAAFKAGRRILTSGEGDVTTHRIGAGANARCRDRSKTVGVNANMTEVMTETTGKKTLRRRIERMTRRVQHVLHNLRDFGPPHLILPAGIAFAADPGRTSACTLALQYARMRRAICGRPVPVFGLESRIHVVLPKRSDPLFSPP